VSKNNEVVSHLLLDRPQTCDRRTGNGSGRKRRSDAWNSRQCSSCSIERDVTLLLNTGSSTSKPRHGWLRHEYNQ